MEVSAPARVAVDLIDRARMEPGRAAIWDGTDSLTYADFEALVGTLAKELDDRRDALGGCGVVPIIVGRDVWSAVAIHAAARAAIAFTPIDESLPAAAVEQLLTRIDSPRLAVVTSATRAAVLPPGVQAVPVPRSPGTTIAPVTVRLDDVASVLFTSGSSGEPKGVVCEWATYDNYFDPVTYRPPADAVDFRVACPAPMSFSAGVSLSMRPAKGMSISIVDPTAMDPIALLEMFDNQRLNQIFLMPSLVTAVLGRWPRGRRLEAVKAVTVFGEPLEWSMVESIRGLVTDDAVIVNYYGATETTSGALSYEISSDHPIGTGRVPLGRPPAPDRMRLAQLSDEPDGPAELIVRGDLARGYWRDPELTARVFGVEADGTRFWRSGDLVRQDADGLIHSRGRADDLVKINGKLVEPSEPERVLNGVGGVRRAVVLVQPGPRGPRLVAHLELDSGSTLTASAVRAEVAASVAPHLVPALMVRHDQLPLTDRGKVDRLALMTGEHDPWLERVDRRAPDAFEVAALDVAAGVLGHDAIGPDDDLWDAGLDSLGASELLAALQGFGWPPLPESVLLEHRTVAALNRLRSTVISTSDIWLNDEATGEVVVCVLPPAGDALTFRRLAQGLGPNRAVAIVRQFDPLAADEPLVTVDQIADGLSQRLAPRLGARPAAVVGYSASGVVAHEVCRRLDDANVTARLVLLDSPAGAESVRGARRPSTTVRRRMRSAARQAWLRSLPPSTMPQRERAYARYELATRAAERHVPRQGNVAAVLFHTTGGGMHAIVDSWSAVIPNIDVIELECDHYTILAEPHIGDVARWIRGGS